MNVFTPIFLLVAVLVIAFGWPPRRKILVFGALFSLPLIVAELLLSGGIDRLGVSVADQITSIVSLVVSTLSLGALAAAFADAIVYRWWGARAHPHRHRLWWLAVGAIVGVVIFAIGEPAPLALMIGLVVNALLILGIEHELVWDATLSSISFAALFALADVVVGIRASGDINRLLIGPSALGPTFFGLPLERILTVALMGALVGPLFAATKFRRSPAIERSQNSPFGKILAVVIIGVLFVASGTWASESFVFPPVVRAIEPVVTDPANPQHLELAMVFSRPVDRQSLVVTVSPVIDGNLSFDEPLSGDHGYRRARYAIETPLPPQTTFNVKVTGIRSVWKVASVDYSFQFTTEATPTSTPPVTEPVVIPEPVVTPTPPGVTPPVVTPPVVTPPAPATPAPTSAPAPKPTSHLIAVAEDFQDQPLSCEAAALKMALAGKGVHVSENDIMNIVGYDPTPHRGNVWGDPHSAFVGNIAGHQNTTGYGVYWEPIQKAASHWRPARVIMGGTIQQLAAEIYADHPVVIWGTLGTAYRDDWKTPSGKNIVAWKGEHARTVIGVNGPADNPTSFVINDPVAGRVTWSAAKLNANWASFNRSGVIVE